MKIASVSPLLPAATISEVRAEGESCLSLFQLACEDEDDEALAPCGGGQAITAATPSAAPVWLEGEESFDLHMGEAAVVPCATSLRGATLSIIPNTAAVCRAFRSVWDTAEGFALVSNLSQPVVHISPGDVVAAALDNGSEEAGRSGAEDSLPGRAEA